MEEKEEEEENVREMLKELQRRKSNFEFNLILLERRRKLREVCEYVDSLVDQTFDDDDNSLEMEKLRARRLIHEKLRKAQIEVVKNVTEKQEKMEEDRKQSPLVSKRGLHETKSRLYRNKNQDCERCDKKRSIEATSCRKKPTPVGGTKLRRPTPNVENPIVTSYPRKEQVSEVLTRPPIVSARRLRVKQLSKSLKDKLRESLSLIDERKRSTDRKIIPLSFCQKNVVSQLTKGTNTLSSSPLPPNLDERVSIENVVRDDGERDLKVDSQRRTLSVRVLPGVNVPGSTLVSLPQIKPRSSYKYVEVLHSDDQVEPNEELIGIRARDFQENYADFRPRTPNNEHYSVEPVTDETRDEFDAARQWLEQELVEYVLSKITLEENVTESVTKPSENGNLNVSKTLKCSSSEEEQKEEQEEVSVSRSSSSSSISVPWVPSPDGTLTQDSVDSGIPNPQPTPLDFPELPKDEEEEKEESGKDVIDLDLPSKGPVSSPIESSVPPYWNPEETTINIPVDSGDRRELVTVERSNPSSSVSHSRLPFASESPIKEPQNQSEHSDDVTVNDTSLDPVTDSKGEVTAMSQSFRDMSISLVIPIRQLRYVAFNRQTRQRTFGSKKKKRQMLDSSAASTTLDETEEQSFTDPSSSTMWSEGEVRPVYGIGVEGSNVLWHRVGTAKNVFLAVENSETYRRMERDECVTDLRIFDEDEIVVESEIGGGGEEEEESTSSRDDDDERQPPKEMTTNARSEHSPPSD